MRITRENTALLIVDFQDRLMPAIHDHGALIAKSTILLRGLAALSIPFVTTRQYPKGLGETIPEIIDCIPEYRPLDKLSFSSLGEEFIREHVLSLHKKYIIVCGIEAHICVLQSVIDLVELGLTPVLVTDCIGSRKPNDKKAAIHRADREGAVITTAESILFELLVRAGSDEFKTISKLIK